jgi:hypothetical protein
MSKTGGLKAAQSKSARGGSYKQAASKMKHALLILLFTILVDRMPTASAEESSILANAQVTEKYLEEPEDFPGNNLIGEGFRNPVIFSIEHDPVGD